MLFETTSEGLSEMLPPKVDATPMKNTTIYVSEDVLERAHAIAKAEKIKSRNKLVASFLAFAVDVFPILKPFRKQIETFAVADGLSYAEAVGALVEKGLKTLK